MRKFLFEALMLLNASLLGSYATAQFKFALRIPWYDWVITSVMFCLFTFLFHREVNKDHLLDKTADLYYDAECHVFRAIIKSTQTVVWQYFYTDNEGLNKHSEYFFSKKEAIEAYIKRASDRRGAEPINYNNL